MILPTDYQPPRWLPNAHLQTVVPALLRRVTGVAYHPECVDTPDGDFLKLDWLRSPGADQLVVLCHGLEGDTQRPYMRGMAKAFHRRGWDVLALNFRGCGGELNRLPRFYHSGATDDLAFVLDRYAPLYRRVGLVGFSLGGNVVLKYLGERGESVPDSLVGAVAFSVPCDLAGSSRTIERALRGVYAARFLRSLRRKVRQKARLHPTAFDLGGLQSVRTLRAFDDLYTAPLHGFLHADDYYERSRSGRVLPEIRLPTLLVNARNDPFLSDASYPIEQARHHQFLYLQIPAEGGHCGFLSITPQREYWSERRSVQFLTTGTER